MTDNYIFKTNTSYEVLTPTGFQHFAGVRKLVKDEYYSISLSNGVSLKCSTTHKFVQNGETILAKDIAIGDVIDSEIEGNIITVVDKTSTVNSIELFDIVEVDNGNLFNVDGVVSHNCDFVSSGDTVIDADLLKWYKETYVMDPIEKQGFDGNLWIWEYPDYNIQYMVVADVARGDSSDYSTAQVLDIENSTQIAEYRGRLDTKDFGNFLVSLATQYNNALLVIENANVGWATIQQVIDRDYPNLFYMSTDLKYVDVARQMTNRHYKEDRQLVAGFSTTTRTRPLLISTLSTYIAEKSIIIRSSRVIEELFVFKWNGGKAEAVAGYNDDLVMALSIGLWVRNTALRLRQEGMDLTRNMLNASHINKHDGVYTQLPMQNNPYEMPTGRGEIEDLKWLLG